MGNALNVSSHYLSIILVCSLVDKFIERQMLFRIAVFGRKLSLTSWKSQAIHDLHSTCASSVSKLHCTRATGRYIERRCLHHGMITTMAKDSDWLNNDSIPFGEGNGWDKETKDLYTWGIHGGPAESPLAGKNFMSIEDLR